MSYINSNNNNYMITLTIQATVTSGTTHNPPYTCVFAQTGTCITFENPIVENIYAVDNVYTATTTATFLDENCFNDSIITATFTDVNGCSNTGTISVSNPCATLNTTISENNEFVFVANTTGGSPSYTYNWNYDTTIFDTQSDSNPTDNILSLNLITTTIPDNTIIQCTVTDNNNCTRTVDYTYNFCQPSWGTIKNNTIPLICDATAISNCSITPVSQRRRWFLGNIINVCSGQEIDWSTLNITHPTNLCIINDGGGFITIGSNSTNGTSSPITITVKTTSGIISEELNLIVSSPVCAARSSVYAIGDTTQLTANDLVGNIITLDTSNRISGSPDWSTMTITTNPVFGTASINPNGDILYTITDITTTPNIPDIIKWSVQSTTGETVFATETILRDIIAPPVAVNDSPICITCGESTNAIDVMANDTGDIVRDTFTITLSDSDITTSIDSDNNVVFTVSPGASFSNLLKYTVRNSQGVESNEGSIIVSAACTGTPQTPLDITCLSKTFDLINFFTGTNAFTTTFVEDGSTTAPNYTAQGGTIVGVNGTVDFTTINAGTYRFKFTASNIAACASVDDENFITIIINDDPSINTVTQTLLSTGLYQIAFNYSSLIENFTISDNGSPATLQTGVTTNGTSGTFNIYTTIGNTITISANTVCGTVINSNIVIV